MITVNNTDIRIRPSAVDSFYDCSYKWAKIFLEGVPQGANSRASIGTAIHSAAEQMWTEAISSNKKEANLGAMTDAAMESWKEQTHDGVRFNDGEDHGSCQVEIIKGAEAFIEDIVPFTPIPIAVEEFYTIELDHPFVSEIGGTVDYISHDTIADLKTSKRKLSPNSYSTQQSIYKMLANANGHNIKHNLIQGVVLKKVPEGMILQMDSNITQAKARVNGMLDTLDLIAKDIVPIESIMRPNPNGYLCDPRFCPMYDNGCPAIKGEEIPVIKKAKL